ncbi:DUF1656 domain-containing protein [Oleiagrimonas sp. C23AA]|uniref:DUF1656 domain-containing protein n=1 Tax=Oleiagrimonas sp. C23AA TaxID=2719047 RepID=UPI0014225B68|nr:DUF1656 domain-containing protein [Oleiagrimonas sp. C23AA]NII09554.1 DUF1656 domain-containing protein [Oleiagrimonas sp. C23AA]
MPAELDIYGVFVPTLLCLMLAAYALKSGVQALLQRTTFYRWIWHPALFNFALFVLLLGGLFAMFRQVTS